MAAVKEFSLEEEYKKDTGITRADIEKLRQWVNTQPHLPKEYVTDLDLILTYHCCERSPEVTKQVLDLNFTLRTLFTGIFKDRKVEAKVENVLKAALYQPLQTRSHDGYAALYLKLIDTDPKNMIVMDHVRTVMMVIDLWQYEEGTWPGLMLIVDLDGVTIGHLSRFDFQALKQSFYYLQEAMFVKLKGFHFLNAPSFMDKILFLLKPFMKNELLDLVKIHQKKGLTTLNEFYPIEGLPKEAGGDYKSVLQCRDEILSKVKANVEFFEMENKKRVVEALRPGQPKTISDIFEGVTGSFKKLDID